MDMMGRPEKYAGAYLKIRDRFSLRSSFFSEYERDINLDGRRVLKFYLKDCSWPCCIPYSEKKMAALEKFSSGDRVTIAGRLNSVAFDDDSLLFFAVGKIEFGW